jgi:hypothetical protein
MNRSLLILIIAILLILAAAMSLAAQGRGHFGGSRGGFNTTPVVRPGPFVVAPPPVAARPPFAVAPAHVPPSFGFRPVHPGRPIRPVVVPPVFGYYSPYIWPTTIYDAPAYSVYSAPAYSQPAYAYPDSQPPAVSQNEINLAYQVGQLSAQVEQLRQQQQQGSSSYTQPISPAEPAAPSAKTPTVLVFKDGRRMEIQNYAISGQTLWVLDERAATRILLSDLDIDATQKENHNRGVRFELPGR